MLHNLAILHRTFDKPCQDVQSAIVTQLRAWQGDNCPNQQSSCAERGLPTNCIECSGMPCGQRCLYNVSFAYCFVVLFG